MNCDTCQIIEVTRAPLSIKSFFSFEIACPIQYIPTAVGTASSANNRAVAVDCDSRRAVGPTKTIRGVYMTQLNRLQRLAALSGIRE